MVQPPFEMPDLDNQNTAVAETETAEQPQAAPLNDDRTQIVAPVPRGEATQALTPSQCPICKSYSPPGEPYCSDCGFLLTSSAPAEPAEQKPIPNLKDTATGKAYYLKDGENTVGRQDADILLSMPSVSRSHAKITLATEGIWIEDLGSANGTKINGKALNAGEKAVLANGNKLEFGSVTVELVIPDGYASELSAAESAPPPPVLEQGLVKLTLVGVSDPGMQFEITGGKKDLGRRSSMDFVIANPYVSGHHATLEIAADKVFITDLGSSNGTKINSAPLQANIRAGINDGDEVIFGQSVFKAQITPNEPIAVDPNTAEPAVSEPEPKEEGNE